MQRFSLNCSYSCRRFPPHIAAHRGRGSRVSRLSRLSRVRRGWAIVNWCTLSERWIYCLLWFVVLYCSENLAHQVLPLRLMPLQMKVHAIGCQSECKKCGDNHRQLAFNEDEDEWRHCLPCSKSKKKFKLKEREKKEKKNKKTIKVNVDRRFACDAPSEFRF